MKQSHFFFWFIFLLSFIHCGGKGSTQVGNPTPTTTGQPVTMTALYDGSTTVTVALLVFGTSEVDLSGAVIDVEVNDILRMNDLSASEHFSSSKSAVIFDVDNLEEGDVLKLDIKKSSSEVVSFKGTVSASSDVTLGSTTTTTILPLSSAVTRNTSGTVDFDEVRFAFLTFDDVAETAHLLIVDEDTCCTCVLDSMTRYGYVSFEIPSKVGVYTTESDISKFWFSNAMDEPYVGYSYSGDSITIRIDSVSTDSIVGTFSATYGFYDFIVEGTFNVTACPGS